MIDFEALQLKRPEVVYDLPAGGRRRIQRASGYRHNFNAGVGTVPNDERTGERPGRPARGAQGTRRQGLVRGARFAAPLPRVAA